jgi:hypothetical protein
MSAGTNVSEILTEDLGKKHAVPEFFPRLLSQEQKEFRAEVAWDFLETANKDPDFPKKVITGVESWVFDYVPETKAHSSQWKLPESPYLKKAQQSQSDVKATLIFFVYLESVFYPEYTSPGHTTTKESFAG